MKRTPFSLMTKDSSLGVNAKPEQWTERVASARPDYNGGLRVTCNCVIEARPTLTGSLAPLSDGGCRKTVSSAAVSPRSAFESPGNVIVADPRPRPFLGSKQSPAPTTRSPLVPYILHLLTTLATQELKCQATAEPKNLQRRLVKLFKPFYFPLGVNAPLVL